jgi:hypothetical protein
MDKHYSLEKSCKTVTPFCQCYIPFPLFTDKVKTFTKVFETCVCLQASLVLAGKTRAYPSGATYGALSEAHSLTRKY